MATFLVDIDGVLRNLVGASDQVYHEFYPDHEPVITNSYALADRYPMWGEDCYRILFEERVEDVFLNYAEPYPGAIDALNNLHNIPGRETILLSKQSGPRIHNTLRWLADHAVDPAIKPLFLPDEMTKGEFIASLQINPKELVMFDDCLNELESAGGGGCAA